MHAFPLLLVATLAAAETDSLVALNTLQLHPGSFARYFDAQAARPRPELAVPLALKPSPAYARTFRRLLSSPSSWRYDDLIREQAAWHGLDARLIKAVVGAESEFSATAVSPAGALGLMQVMPATARGMGVSASLFDPAANVRAGASYLAHLFARAFKRYGLGSIAYTSAPAWLVQRVLAAYHAGPRFLARRPLYRGTRGYVRRVLLFYQSKVTQL